MFKKGDKVYSILRGWGEVTTGSDPELLIRVKYPDGQTITYMHNGKRDDDDINPELYHTEPVITVPKGRVEHTGWVAIQNGYDEGYSSRNATRVYDDKDCFDANTSFLKSDYTIQQITYYTEE